MPFRFNQILRDLDIDPAEVRLLRHQPNVGGKSLLEVWRSDQPAFDDYQAHQMTAKRAYFTGTYWAAFIGTWDGRTVFAGLYRVGGPSVLSAPFRDALSGVFHEAGTVDHYPTEEVKELDAYSGKLFIEWGGGSSGRRAWAQRAITQDKQVTELRLQQTEEPFPGFMMIAPNLSSLPQLPPTWAERLATAKGVYLLSCPRDGSLYVGSATAEGGFWSRWNDYRTNGHGGNVALKGREQSDFVASILQVAGSGDNPDDIRAAEQVWKIKLQTRDLGLNRN
jgi:hypothetical protein